MIEIQEWGSLSFGPKTVISTNPPMTVIISFLGIYNQKVELDNRSLPGHSVNSLSMSQGSANFNFEV